MGRGRVGRAGQMAARGDPAGLAAGCATLPPAQPFSSNPPSPVLLPAIWDRISDAARARIASRYTWTIYAQRLMTLTRVYGFWKFSQRLENEGRRRYLDALYQLVMRPLVARVPVAVDAPGGDAVARARGADCEGVCGIALGAVPQRTGSM